MLRREFIASLLTLPAVGRGEVWGPRVYLQNVTGSGATLRWIPAELCDVEYGAAGEAPRMVFGGRGEARLTELTPGTEYRYRLRPGGEEAAFRTAGEGRTPFLVIGDTGTGSPEQTALAERLVRERTHFLLHTGDVAYPTGQAEAYEKRYADYYHALMARTPFFPCPGNHDYYETRAEPYFSFHDLPPAGVPDSERGRYYSFDWGDATVVSIDSNEPLEDPGRRVVMLDWLDRTLGGSTRFWRIVFFHHPPYAAGPNQHDALTRLARQFLVPALERHRVPLVLNGHEHSYQRSIPVGLGETTYVTTGGGGAPLYPVGLSPYLARGVTANHYLRGEIAGYGLGLSAVGLDGAEFDRVALRPRPMLRENGVGNAASFQARIGRGSPISMFGWQLGLAGDGAVTLTANGQPLELLAVTPAQINALLPMPLVGRVRLVLTTPNGSAEAEAEVLALAPALFAGTVREAVRAGSAMGVYATGMAGWSGAVTARIGGRVVGCRLLAGPVEGVQRVELTVPEGVASGMAELTVVAGGEWSNTIAVPVA